jgi:hypothetical protein
LKYDVFSLPPPLIVDDEKCAASLAARTSSVTYVRGFHHQVASSRAMP